MFGQNAYTNRLIKENVNVEQLFSIYLAQLIFSGPELSSSQRWAYKLREVDEATRSDLKARVKAALATPQETSAYRFIKSDEESQEAGDNALRYVEFAGLIVLILLGEREKIADLLQFMRENHQDLRAREIVSGFLLYLTGEDIGSFALTEEDLDLWEAWWKKNKNRFTISIS